MKTDQNRAKLGGKVMPEPAPMNPPMFPEHDWEATSLVSTSRIRPEQQAIKEGVNDPSIAAQISPTDGRQVPSPAASAAEFQPCQCAPIGDLVTGPDPRNADTVPAIVTGTLMSGGAFPTARSPRVPLQDWPANDQKQSVNNAPPVGKE